MDLFRLHSGEDRFPIIFRTHDHGMRVHDLRYRGVEIHASQDCTPYVAVRHRAEQPVVGFDYEGDLHAARINCFDRLPDRCRGSNEQFRPCCHVRNSLAGTPATSVRGATSSITTAPAPITLSAPMRTPWITVLPVPMWTLSPTSTVPDSVTPGAICTCAPTRQSWSIDAPVLTIESSPIEQSGWTIPPAITCTPSPSRALGAMIAVGWITLANV